MHFSSSGCCYFTTKVLNCINPQSEIYHILTLPSNLTIYEKNLKPVILSCLPAF